MRLFGAAGLTPEYPLEKLLRDCQASLIEDGENNLLGLNAVGPWESYGGYTHCIRT